MEIRHINALTYLVRRHSHEQITARGTSTSSILGPDLYKVAFIGLNFNRDLASTIAPKHSSLSLPKDSNHNTVEPQILEVEMTKTPESVHISKFQSVIFPERCLWDKSTSLSKRGFYPTTQYRSTLCEKVFPVTLQVERKLAWARARALG